MNFFQALLPSACWTGETILIISLLTMPLIPLLMYGWMRHRPWS